MYKLKILFIFFNLFIFSKGKGQTQSVDESTRFLKILEDSIPYKGEDKFLNKKIEQDLLLDSIYRKQIYVNGEKEGENVLLPKTINLKNESNIGLGYFEERSNLNYNLINIGNDTLDAIEKRMVNNFYSRKFLDTLSVFGLNFFNRKDVVFYKNAADVRPSEDYILGVGDQLNLVIYGGTSFNRVFEIQQEGFIEAQYVGRVYLKGLTLKAARELLKNRFSKYYNLNQSGFEITVTYSRVVNVSLVGEATNPGSYIIPAVNSIFNFLSYVGGPNEIGSVRNIEVKRNGDVVERFDLYKFILSADQVKNIYLQQNDFIYIPPIKKKVTIVGEIQRPYTYELLDNEGLEDLINFAAGLLPSAYSSSIQIRRIIGGVESFIDVDLEAIKNSNGKFLLQNGDLVYVRKMPKTKQNFITVKGAVVLPGNFEFIEGNRLSDLIDKAKGLKDEAYTTEAFLTRTNKDLTQTGIKINLSEILKNPSSKSNIEINNLDVLEIFSNTDFRDNFNLSIEGAVRNPKNIIFSEGTTLKDMIMMSGGLLPTAMLEKALIARYDITSKSFYYINTKLDTTNNLDGLSAFLLRPNDKIIILQKSNDLEGKMVSISGAVKLPGKFEMWKDLSLRDVILMAGGLKESAFLQKGYIYRTKPDLTKEILNFKVEKENDFLTLDEIKLSNNDQVVILSNTQFAEFYSVKTFGELVHPGEFNYQENMTLADVITLSGGLKLTAILDRVEVSRIINFDEILLNSAPAKVEVVSLKLGPDIYNDPIANDFKLKPYDQIFIRNQPNFVQQKNVKLAGEIFYPGTYPIKAKDERIASIIERSGGLTNYAYPKGAVLIRQYDTTQRVFINLEMAIRRKKSKHNILLSEGDSLYVPQTQDIVTLIGTTTYSFDKVRMANPSNNLSFYDYDSIITKSDSMVYFNNYKSVNIDYFKYQLKIPYSKNKRASYYIRNYAAGFNEFSKKKRTYVVQPDGTINDTKRVFFKKIYPKVQGGGIIVVPKRESKYSIKREADKKEKSKKDRRFDVQTFLTTTVTALTSALTIIFLVKNNNR